MMSRPFCILVTIVAINSESTTWTGTIAAVSSNVFQKEIENFQCDCIVSKCLRVKDPFSEKACQATSVNGYKKNTQRKNVAGKMSK